LQVVVDAVEGERVADAAGDPSRRADEAGVAAVARGVVGGQTAGRIERQVDLQAARYAATPEGGLRAGWFGFSC
jgi:hypothetical protein